MFQRLCLLVGWLVGQSEMLSFYNLNGTYDNLLGLVCLCWPLGRLLEAQIFVDAYGTQNIIHLPQKPHNFKENDLGSIPALRTKHIGM